MEKVVRQKYSPQFPSFSVRPKYRTGESLSGYIYRYLSENGHRVSFKTEKFLSDIFRGLKGGIDLETSTEAIQRLYELLGFDSEVSEAWIAILDACDTNYRTNLNFVYCPYCLYNEGIHLRTWSLEWAGYCRLHGDRLWRRYWKCNQVLRWSMIKPDWHCQCGGLLTITENSLLNQIHRLKSIGSGSQCTEFTPHQITHIKKQTVKAEGHKTPSAIELQKIAKQLRASIVKSLTPKIKNPRKLPSGELFSRFNDAWEIHIAAHWPLNLQSEIYRLSKFHWRRSSVILISITKNSVAHSFTTAIACANFQQNKPAAKILMEEFRAPVRSETFIIFNPRHKTPQRQERLKKFWAWWLVICPSTSHTFQGKSEPTVHQNESNTTLAISGISQLVEAAWANRDPHRFKSVVCLMLTSDPEINSAGDIFELIEIILSFTIEETIQWVVALNEVGHDPSSQTQFSSAG